MRSSQRCLQMIFVERQVTKTYMATMDDYLEWRGDLPLTVDPFNEVDNLILVQMAYIDFDGVVCAPGDHSPLTLAQVNEAYWQLHTKEEVLARKTFVSSAPFLMDKAAQTARFGSVLLTDYVNIVSVEKQEQMAVLTYLLPDGTSYVAFRGTDDTVIGWKEDFNLSYMEETLGQKHAVEYMNQCFQGNTRPLRVGGHSKGGNFAVYASAFADPSIQKQITEVYSNDGPGLLYRLTQAEGYQAILPLVNSIVPEDSIVGMLMASGASHHVVKSSAQGILQHDATTWLVRGKHFEECKTRSSLSLFFEKTLHGWIDNIGEEHRKEFVDTLFSFLLGTGASTITDVNRDLLGSLQSMVKAYGSLSEDDRNVFNDVVGRLVKSGSDTLQEGVSQEAKSLQEEFVSGAKAFLQESIASGTKAFLQESIASGTKALQESFASGTKAVQNGIASGTKAVQDGTSSGTKTSQDGTSSGTKISQDGSPS